MKRIRILLVMALASIVAGPVAAQTTGIGEERSVREDPFRGSGDREARETMAEHIAVFRVLLTRAVEKTYGFPIHAPAVHGHGGAARDAFHQLPQPEGVYLRGHGVVYSVSAPHPPSDPLGKGTTTDVKELSPWERARRELRGEKATQPEKETVPGQTSLSETLLRLIAANGKNFSLLPANERITVAVTFRSNLDCVKCHQNPWKGEPRLKDPGAGGARLQRLTDPLVAEGPIHLRTTVFATQPPSSGTEPGSTANAEIKNEVLLGDLHMKQGRYQEAAKTYSEAFKKQLDLLAPPEKRTQAEVAKLLTAVEITHRLAQALLAQGKPEEARQVMSSGLKIAEAAVKLADGRKGTPGERGIPLPSQLIVSVPKKLLGQVADGKISFEEFAESAPVEYIRFPAAKDDKKENKKP